MPSIPFAASSRVAYLTKPKPLEYPDTRSVTTLAVNGKRSIENFIVTTKDKSINKRRQTNHELLHQTGKRIHEAFLW